VNEHLFRTERDKLVAHLARDLGWADAEDVVSEAFLRIDSDSSAGLLWKTALNLGKNFRAMGHRTDVQLDPQLGASDPIAGALLRADLVRAIRSLPRLEREAFVLIEMCGMSQEEAAAAMGESRKTTNLRAQAALTHLREELS